MRPGGRFGLHTIQLDRTVIVLDGLIEFPEIVKTEPQGVVSTHHLWIKLNNPFQLCDGGCVVVRVIIKTRQPVQVERISGLGRGQLLQFGSGPVSPSELDIGHCQREPVAVGKRS